MTYSIDEVSEMLNISISTLRYYDKEGLLSLINRTSGNIRVFDETDIEWCEEGDSPIAKRHNLFMEQKEKTEKQIAHMQNALDRINYKCKYYRIAKDGTTTNDN